MTSRYSLNVSAVLLKKLEELEKLCARDVGLREMNVNTTGCGIPGTEAIAAGYIHPFRVLFGAPPRKGDGMAHVFDAEFETRV